MNGYTYPKGERNHRMTFWGLPNPPLSDRGTFLSLQSHPGGGSLAGLGLTAPVVALLLEAGGAKQLLVGVRPVPLGEADDEGRVNAKAPGQFLGGGLLQLLPDERREVVVAEVLGLDMN